MRLIIVNTQREARAIQEGYDSKEVMVVGIETPLYGHRFTSITVETHTEQFSLQQYERYQEWLDSTVTCRLEPSGRWE